MTKTYRYTFNYKAQARRFYNALRNKENLCSRSVCYLIQKNCYEVVYTCKVAEREGA